MTATDDPTGDVVADLELAISIADRVDEFTLAHFLDRDFTVDWKQNATEVTEIDRRAEQMIVDDLLRSRPGDTIVGEEHGVHGDPRGARCWVVDPIDGTSGFVRGIPVWATLLSLVIDGRPALGVVSAPALATRWIGVAGGPAVVRAHGRERALRVSTVERLDEAQVSVTHSPGWDALGLTDRLVSLQQAARRSRGMGDFWQHMLVAEGAMDVAVDAIGVAPYDLAAVMAVVEAAGGTFSDRRGVATHLHDSAISSNGLLHDEVVQALSD